MKNSDPRFLRGCRLKAHSVKSCQVPVRLGPKALVQGNEVKLGTPIASRNEM